MSVTAPPNCPPETPDRSARQVIGSVADLVYMIVSVEAESGGAAVGVGCRSWSLLRVTVASQAAGCGPRFLPRNPVYPARAAQPRSR